MHERQLINSRFLAEFGPVINTSARSCTHTHTHTQGEIIAIVSPPEQSGKSEMFCSLRVCVFL